MLKAVNTSAAGWWSLVLLCCVHCCVLQYTNIAWHVHGTQNLDTGQGHVHVSEGGVYLGMCALLSQGTEGPSFGVSSFNVLFNLP